MGGVLYKIHIFLGNSEHSIKQELQFRFRILSKIQHGCYVIFQTIGDSILFKALNTSGKMKKGCAEKGM